MKHIHDILSGYGLTVPEDRRADFDRELGENYATAEAMAGLQTQLKTATDGLKAFEGVDVNALNGRITQLTKDLAAQAAAQLARYKRMYTVTASEDHSEAMAVCAMVDGRKPGKFFLTTFTPRYFHSGSASSTGLMVQTPIIPFRWRKAFEFYPPSREDNAFPVVVTSHFMCCKRKKAPTGAVRAGLRL